MAREQFERIDIIRLTDLRTDAAVAYSCGLKPCIRTYAAAKVIRSVLEEVAESTFLMSDEEGFNFADLDCVSSVEKVRLEDLGYIMTENQRWLPYNISVGYNSTEQRITYQDICIYEAPDLIDELCHNHSSKGDYTDIVPARCM